MATASALMKRTFFFVLIIIGLVCKSIFAQANGEDLIIKFKPDPTGGLQKITKPDGAFLANLRSQLGDFQQRMLLPPKIATSKLGKSVVNPFSRVVVLHFSQAVLPESLLDSLNALPEVDYACRNHTFHVDQLTGDPDFAKQWGLTSIRIAAAWQQTRGSQSVPIVLIDTGIDRQHEDLQGQIWVNPGEDLNGNDVADSSDYNGVDDDGNGYVDDLAGWDFVDSPRYPDNGDYREPDNQPADEHGHGTAIAGILVAKANNGLGIAGVAPESRVVNLRAGTSQGLLEEDDVAAAILYAVAMKFRIINMSFGDVLITPLLRDVIRYAYQNGVIMIASAGNSGDDSIHYPSGLSETISVGAVTQWDYRADFSTFGSSLDLVAPGVGIFTTLLHNQYGEVSGTSAAAPFVSATVALLLTLRPELSVEVVRDQLLQTCDDLGAPGWEYEYGAGRLRADLLLADLDEATVQILSPQQDQGFYIGEIPVVGTCAGALVDRWEVSVGVGLNPTEWQVLQSTTKRQIIADTLTSWHIPDGVDTNYTLQLRGLSRDGRQLNDYASIHVDQSPPVVSNFSQLPIRQGTTNGIIYGFDCDDFCLVTFFSRPVGSGGNFLARRLPFQNTRQADLVADSAGSLDFYLEIQNRSGLTTRYPSEPQVLRFEFDTAPPPDNLVMPLNLNLPAGYLLTTVTDFNANGAPEIVMNEYEDGQNFGNLVYWEKNGEQFQRSADSGYHLIPRDVGDVNGDGFAEVLAGAGKASVLLAKNGANPFPTRIVWLDTNDVWAGKLYDFNSDGYPELLAKVGNLWKLWRNNRDYSFSPLVDLPNLTPGENGTGVPHVEIADFDSDARIELLFGDGDGDIYLYEMDADLNPVWQWQTHLPLIDAIDFLAVGDWDGDGQAEFAVGCHSASDLDLEHQFDERHWLFRIYDFAAGNFQPVLEQRFYGFSEPKDFDSGMSSGDINGDGKPELLLSIYPHLYVVNYDQSDQEYRVSTHYQPAQSNRIIVHDLNRDNHPEILFNQGDRCGVFQYSDETPPLPPFPTNLQAVALDSNQIQLSWENTALPDSFRIYRGTQSNDLTILASLWTTKSFLDTALVTDQRYWYQVAHLRRNASESFSEPVTAQPHRPAQVKSPQVFPPDQMLLQFTLPMSAGAGEVENYRLQSTGQPPSTAAQSQNLMEVVLTWSGESLLPEQDSLVLANLTDSSGTPLARRSKTVAFSRSSQTNFPFIVRAEFCDQQHLQIEFSEPMQAVSLLVAENYRLEPAIPVQTVRAIVPLERAVELELQSVRPIGPVGIRYDLYVRNLLSLTGVPINDELGSHVVFLFTAADLRNVIVYPNPAINHALFVGLTPQAQIEIFNSRAILVRRLQVETNDGGCAWDLRDDSGQLLPAGIYLYRVFNQQESHWGKFAVVR